MSWLSTLFEAAKQERGEVFVFGRMPQQGGGLPARSMRSGTDYVTISVLSSRIVNVRKWSQKFHAAVHSCASYLHCSKGNVELQSVLISPQMKELDPTNVDRMITVRQRVLGPVVYMGGLALELGLFSVQGADLASPYIDFLTSVAKAASPAFVGQATAFADPLRKGCELLFGNKNQAELEIGIDITWPNAETGTWILMRAPAGSVPIEHLKLHPESFHLVDESGNPFRDYPYVVLSVDANQRRDDWMLIPELLQAWNALAKAAASPDPADQKSVHSLLQRFVVLCRWSPDLVPKDVVRLQKKAEAKIDSAATGRLASMNADWSFGGLKLYQD